MFHDLERRRYFTDLSITGTAVDDAIALSVAGAMSSGLDVRIRNNGTRPITIKVNNTAIQLAVAKTIRTEQIVKGGVVKVRLIDLGAGDDTLQTDAALNVPMQVRGGDGYDTLATGSAADLIDGDAENDVLNGGAGDDTLRGNGDGPAASTDYDLLRGGTGNDLLVAFDPPRTADPDEGDYNNSTLYGGDGRDTLRAGRDGDYLLGESGDDSLAGSAGRDYLNGGNGNDTLAGGKGDDHYEFYEAAAATEADVIIEKAGEGTDEISLDDRRFHDENYDPVDSDPITTPPTYAAARVDLSAPANIVVQGKRRVSVAGGIANAIENVQGSPKADTLVGTDGPNVLLSYVDEVIVFNGPLDGRTDFFIGDSSADSVDGRGGNDTLNGCGRDRLTGGGGNDLFELVEKGADVQQVTISGDSGTDTVRAGFIDGDIKAWRLGAGVEKLYLLGGAAGEIIGNELNNYIFIGTETVSNYAYTLDFNLVRGGAGNDTIEGGLAAYEADYYANPRLFDGGEGNDLLIGAASPFNEPNDYQYLRGGPGRDTLKSASGDVWADYGYRTSGVKVDLSTGGFTSGSDVDTFDPGVQSVRGTPFNDTLVGTADDNAIFGMGGNDRIEGRNGNDTLGGGASDAAGPNTADGNDTLIGGNGNDMADYRFRTDNLTIRVNDVADDGATGEKDDVRGDFESVLGGSGKDAFFAGPQGTAFYGNEGADTFTGGAGIDTVYYELPGVDNFYDPVRVTLDNKSNDGLPNEKDNVTSSIDRVIGTSGGGDYLAAGPRDAILDGLASVMFESDSLIGNSGDDVLIFGNAYTGAFAQGKGGDDLFVNQNGSVDTIDGGDGFDSVQDDDTDDAEPGLQNDLLTNVEFVYDEILTEPANRPARAIDATPAFAVVSGITFDEAKRVLRVVGTPDADTITLGVSRGNVVATLNGVTKRYALSTIRRLTVDAGGGKDAVTLTGAVELPGEQRVRVFGGSGNDTLLGNEGNEILEGGAGNDYVDGGGENDVVSGGYVVLLTDTTFPPEATDPDGSDTIIGGAGATDLVTYTRRDTPIAINLTAQTAKTSGESDVLKGVEYVIAGQARDTLVGVNLGINETLYGGPGADTLTSGSGVDRFFGGRGNDLINPGPFDDVNTGGRDGVEDRINGRVTKRGVTLTPADLSFTGSFQDDDLFLVNNIHWGDRDNA